MFDPIKRLEKKIRKLENEVKEHEFKKKTTRIKSEIKIHEFRRRGAQEALDQARTNLIIAKAEAARKKKKS